MRFRDKIRPADGTETFNTPFAWFPTRVTIHIGPVQHVQWVWLRRYCETRTYYRYPGPGDFWTAKRWLPSEHEKENQK